jgi:catechol 2,3-dioxygenase-like lactoylglutathione lyase family enzyme
MKTTHVVLTLVALAMSVPAGAADAKFHHVHVTAASPPEAARWYIRHLNCQAIPDRNDAADCQGVEVMFVAQTTMGGTQGTGVNHIGFSYADLSTKMDELASVGVRGSGVRLQRFEDGSTLRDVPGLFKVGFIFDPWGTRIELVEDAEYVGFHHVHFSSNDPAATLAWYQKTFGGKAAKLRGKLDGILLGDVWLLASRHNEGDPAPTRNRALDHIGFSMANLGKAAANMRRQGVSFQEEPAVPVNARSSAKRAFLVGPDSVRIAVVEPGFAGIKPEIESTDVSEAGAPYTAPRTPWGEPDLQGVWSGNSSHGIPLERPLDLAEVQDLTTEQAAARRERGTLGSIWGYEREWRDTTLGYDKMKPSTQVAMIVDPPNGRLPEMTVAGKRIVEQVRIAREKYTTEPVDGPEDMTPYVRCITRGLPGMMMPSIYNNGLQIVQGPGHVAIQKEMVHETRVIPTKPRPPVSAKLTTWLGDPQGHWEGDSLVVETLGFNGKSSYRGTTKDMKLTERFTRIGETKLAYEFTVDDPTVWTAPWTARFGFDLDNAQYDLVEYACHEGNYGMFNILSGARARDKEAGQ